MQTVIYRSNKCAECQCDAEIIVCLVDDTKLVSGTKFLAATLLKTTETADTCMRPLYNYYIEYDETLLVDPTVLLLNADIAGFICRGCLTDYIDYLFSLIEPT